ncbi:MAG: response regulator, partial [Pseudomonadota bacterium]
MSQKCALIVDDSRSARVVLQRMLETHELDVDTAESAEEALTYLADHRPDVIFMDHMMPGMDGFEAVQAIKQNPNTATIPIMMYTSQEGELYVGQARALGAVGVLPKQVEPVEVSRMLTSLRLIPGLASANGDELRDALADVESSGITRIDEIDHNLRDLIQDLFEQQRAILRRDMLDSYETIAARVAEEISPAGDDAGVEEGPAAPARLSGAATAALLLLGAVAALFAFLYWQAESRWLNERDARAALADSLRSEQAFSADGTVELQRSLTESQLRLEAVYGDAIAAIEWAFNLDATYPWDSVPLDDALAERISQLIARLESIDFAGLVM